MKSKTTMAYKNKDIFLLFLIYKNLDTKHFLFLCQNLAILDIFDEMRILENSIIRGSIWFSKPVFSLYLIGAKKEKTLDQSKMHSRCNLIYVVPVSFLEKKLPLLKLDSKLKLFQTSVGLN